MKQSMQIIVLACLVPYLFCCCGEAEAARTAVASQPISIQFDDPEQMEKVVARLRPSALNRALDKIFLGSTPNWSAAATSLPTMLDGLFQQVQRILEMPRPELSLTIHFYADASALAQVAQEVGGPIGAAPAFYWKKTHTIHANGPTVTIGILAHEMAHAVLDDYFVIQPPAKISELLCQYVEKEVMGTQHDQGARP